MDSDNDQNLFDIHDESNSSDANTNQASNSSKKLLEVTKAKSCKTGIIYMGYVPEGMTPKNIRLLLDRFGDIGRIFLERDKTITKNHKSRKYIEGWIEFKKKSVAKMVAHTLNGTAIGGKRRTQFYGALWNLKYLKRFKWSHLAEQMTYEKALREQQLRLEINRAKKEATFYTNMIDRSRHKKQIFNDPNRSYKQRVTDEQIRLEKQSDELDEDFLANIFK